MNRFDVDWGTVYCTLISNRRILTISIDFVLLISKIQEHHERLQTHMVNATFLNICLIKPYDKTYVFEGDFGNQQIYWAEIFVYHL